MERDYMGDDAVPVVDVAIDTVEQNEHDRLERLLRGVVHTIMATHRVAMPPDPQRNVSKRHRRSRRSQTIGTCALLIED